MVKETGKTFHFQPDGRGRLPRTVRSHDMIAKHVGQAAKRSERLAQAEAEAGHRETAMELYYQAALQYADAQHVVFETGDEKRFLHGGVIRCYDKVREHAPYTIEHVDVPWNGTVVSGNLHLAPGDGPKPLVFYVPGCDQTKEAWPHPVLQPGAPARHARVLVRRPGAGREQPARHPADRGQLRGRRERGDRHAAEAPGDRSRRRSASTRCQLRLVLGHAHRGEGAAHRRRARRRGRRSSTSTT